MPYFVASGRVIGALCCRRCPRAIVLTLDRVARIVLQKNGLCLNEYPADVAYDVVSIVSN